MHAKRCSTPSGYYRVSVTPNRMVRLDLKTMHVDHRAQSFVWMLRGRPQDKEWLIEKGALAKCLRIPFPDAYRMTRAHIKKLCGYRRPRWINEGLLEGYENWGLRS